MYTIKVRSKFSSAHNLRGYQGKCEALHGHNWNVEVEVSALEVDDTGMVLDFTELKRILNEIVGELDHKYLNDIEYFKAVNPTSENIARYVHEKILYKNPDLNVSKVIVWETETSSATYIAEEQEVLSNVEAQSVEVSDEVQDAEVNEEQQSAMPNDEVENVEANDMETLF